MNVNIFAAEIALSIFVLGVLLLGMSFFMGSSAWDELAEFVRIAIVGGVLIGIALVAALLSIAFSLAYKADAE